MRTGKPFLIAGVPIAGLALHSFSSGGHVGVASAWMTPPSTTPSSHRAVVHNRAAAARMSTTTSTRPTTTTTTLLSSTDLEIESLHLTPELQMMTEAFSSIPDEKTRHKQLLHMASKLPNVDDSVRIMENKVPGCLSTVFVDCSVVEKEEEEGGELMVNYVGDSDGLLTKGLLALLIRGLSGCTPEQINAVDPQFVQAAKISQTLTPGRNNGFLNMLAVMKKKASEAVEKREAAANNNGDADGDANVVEGKGNAAAESTSEDNIGDDSMGPMYNAILTTLTTVLKPTSITLTDNSSKHAGHAGSKGFDGESHFALEIVAEAFDGLNLVKRHQLIYMLLGEVMPKIHALEISARSTSEVE
ncbi:hypothetical protein ACHAXR_008677 [Thalassiosira sp. AJA248-18]